MLNGLFGTIRAAGAGAGAGSVEGCLACVSGWRLTWVAADELNKRERGGEW